MITKASINFICVFLFTIVTVAHGGVERITGTVRRISARSIAVETAGNKPTTVTIFLILSTTLFKDGQDTSYKELEVGTRVVVHTKSNVSGLDAVSVVFGKPPALGNNDRLRRRPAPGSVTA